MKPKLSSVADDGPDEWGCPCDAVVEPKDCGISLPR